MLPLLTERRAPRESPRTSSVSLANTHLTSQCQRPLRSRRSRPSCRFYMIKAEFIRGYSGLKLPFFQEIRSKHPEAIVEVTITYAEVVSGTHGRYRFMRKTI